MVRVSVDPHLRQFCMYRAACDLAGSQGWFVDCFSKFVREVVELVSSIFQNKSKDIRGVLSAELPTLYIIEKINIPYTAISLGGGKCLHIFK